MVDLSKSPSSLKPDLGMPDIVSRYSMNKHEFTHKYYESFIQKQNKRLMVAHSMNFKRKNYVLEEVAKKNDHKRRFDSYMEVMVEEE